MRIKLISTVVARLCIRFTKRSIHFLNGTNEVHRGLGKAGRSEPFVTAVGRGGEETYFVCVRKIFRVGIFDWLTPKESVGPAPIRLGFALQWGHV